MRNATPQELRLAVMALAAAAGSTPAGMTVCAEIMEIATSLAANAGEDDLDAAIGPTPIMTRLRTVGMLAAICGACAACPRGQALQPAEIIAAPRRGHAR